MTNENADAEKRTAAEVRLGEDTLDEICLASIGIVYPNTAVTPPAAMPMQ